MLVTKIIDALTDTGMGLIVDRTKTRWGQGRPYFLIGALPFAIFTVLTFIVPDFNMTGKIICICYLLPVKYCLYGGQYSVKYDCS